MRQITITAPEGSGSQVAQIAFAVGISHVSVSAKRILNADGSEIVKDSIELEVGTPLAKAFLDQFTSAPFFSRDKCSIAVRQPRALVSREPLSRLTRPLVEPAVDIFEELWQFSQVTYGFVGRILIGGLLLAYGLVEYKLLFMIAGLLFIPLLPLMLSVGFGLWTQQWRLVVQGFVSLVLAICLLVVGGVVVAFLTNPPVQYSDFSSLSTGLLISLIVGIAAGLATADDVGRREMIGLAATAQIAIVPAWFGLCLVLGFPAAEATTPARRILGLFVNIVAIVIAALGTYAAMRIKGSSLSFFKTDRAKQSSVRVIGLRNAGDHTGDRD
jgi:hypothetical protein